MKPIINEFDAMTGENVSREMTEAELEQYAIDQAETKKRQENEAQQLSTKISAIAKLAALGLTEDEAKAIMG
jgi:hypothetical protein